MEKFDIAGEVGRAMVDFMKKNTGYKVALTGDQNFPDNCELAIFVHAEPPEILPGKRFKISVQVAIRSAAHKDKDRKKIDIATGAVEKCLDCNDLASKQISSFLQSDSKLGIFGIVSSSSGDMIRDAEMVMKSKNYIVGGIANGR